MRSRKPSSRGIPRRGLPTSPEPAPYAGEPRPYVPPYTPSNRCPEYRPTYSESTSRCPAQRQCHASRHYYHQHYADDASVVRRERAR